MEKSDKQPDNGKEKKDGDNNKNEVESLAEKQRETLPITERIEMFKAMLLEKEVKTINSISIYTQTHYIFYIIFLKK